MSSKVRFTVKLLATLFIVFSVGNAITYYMTKQNVLKEANIIAMQDLDKLMLKADNLLSECENSAFNLLETLKYDNTVSEDYYEVVDSFLSINPHIYGVSIAYEPDMMKTVGASIPALFTYGNDSVGYHHLRLDSLYDYQQADWYRMTKEANKPHWGKALVASDGELIAPFCIPLFSEDGRFAGVIAYDLSLNSLTDYMLTAVPYPDAIVAMLDKDLTYIAHPQEEMIMRTSLDTSLDFSNIEVLNPNFLNEIRNGIKGTNEYKIQGKKRLVYYTPVKKTNWTIVIDCPYDNIYAAVDNVNLFIIINMFVGMLLFIYIGWILIRRVSQFEKAAGQKAAIQGELSTAHDIQLSMVTKVFPNRQDIDIYGTLCPAKEVGGDLYDFYIVEDTLIFCIGDVSGKGVPASLFMAITRSLFRNIAEHVQSPAEIAKTLNNAICENNEQNMFITMFIGSCNMKTGEFACCNCGHNIPVTNADVIDPATMTVGPGPKMRFMSRVPTNIAVGIMPDFPYEEIKMKVTDDVALYLYTDGITEAENPKKELYGDKRLLKTCQKLFHSASTKEVVEGIHNDVIKFADGQEQSDDITILAFHYRSPKAE